MNDYSSIGYKDKKTFCTSCGKEKKESERFCPSCGFKSGAYYNEKSDNQTIHTSNNNSETKEVSLFEDKLNLVFGFIGLILIIYFFSRISQPNFNYIAYNCCRECDILTWVLIFAVVGLFAGIKPILKFIIENEVDRKITYDVLIVIIIFIYISAIPAVKCSQFCRQGHTLMQAWSGNASCGK